MPAIFKNGIFLCSVSIFNVQAQFVLSKCCPNRRSVCQARLWCRHLCVQTVDERWLACGVRWEIPWQQHNVVHQPPGPHRLGRVHLQRQQRLKLWFSQMQHPGQASNLLLDLQVHNHLSWKRSTWGGTPAPPETPSTTRKPLCLWALFLVVANYIWKDSNVFSLIQTLLPLSVVMLVCTVLNMLLIGISVIFADKYRIILNY